jgi:hypothetical protein
MLVASFLSIRLGGGAAFGAATACDGAAGFSTGFAAGFGTGVGAGAVALAGALALTRFFGVTTRLLRETAFPFRAFVAGAFAALFAGAPRRALLPALLPLGLGI